MLQNIYSKEDTTQTEGCSIDFKSVDKVRHKKEEH